MKTFSKITKLFLAFALFMGLSGCSGIADKKGFEDATYATIYDKTLDASLIDTLPEYQFLLDDVRDAVNEGLCYEITLILEGMGDYTLIAHLYNPNQSDPTASDYLEVRYGVVGCYTKDGDVVNLGPAEWGDANFHAGSNYEKYRSFSYNEDGSDGDIYSDSTPEMLAYYSSATITVSGGNIVSWEVVK